MSKQRYFVGIDLGTTFSSLAYVDEQGRVEALRLPDGSFQVASAIYFKSPTEIVTGTEALNYAVIDPSRVARAFKRRMGWRFPLYSSIGSDFNFDYRVSFTPEELAAGEADYNYRTDPVTIGSEAPGVSVFARDESGQIFHTYSTYARGLDMLNVAYHYLDIVPKGRDENAQGVMWVHRRDEYPD